MESFFSRPDYKEAKARVEKAIAQYKAIGASGLQQSFEVVEEVMIASYQMAKVIKDGNGYVAEKYIPSYNIPEAIDELVTQLDTGTLREEAWALEVVSRTIFRILPVALAASLNLDDNE